MGDFNTLLSDTVIGQEKGETSVINNTKLIYFVHTHTHLTHRIFMKED